MAQALYRKYRSRSFGELVGQEHVTRTLGQAVEQGKISHAYLFTGPRGIGKTSIARILAHTINKLEYSDKPHLDIIEIDAASNRRIEDVRDLREKVQIAPVSAKYKVYIIDEVHMLTTESFNALLKTLEEPPAHVVFILATTELHKLPATITSRTQRFAFAPPSKEAIAAHLKHVAGQENIAISPEALALLAEHADGSFRDSISLLDQVSAMQSEKNDISEAEVAAMLGLPPQSSVQAILDDVAASNPVGVAEKLAALKAAGTTAATTANALIRTVFKEAPGRPALTRLLDALLIVPKHAYPEAKLLAVLLDAAQAQAVSSTPKLKEPEEQKQQTVPTKPKSVPLTVSKPKPASTTEKPVPLTTPALPGAAAERWTEVLAALPPGNAPLRGTLKYAEVRTPGADPGKIILAFKYSLYSKKLATSKHKQVLAAALASVLCLEDISIEAIVDTSAQPTPVEKETVPPPALNADPAAASIIGIMGGGEMVEYT